MKIVQILFVLLLFGCGNKNEIAGPHDVILIEKSDDHAILMQDSCLYIIIFEYTNKYTNRGGVSSHKGDCPNPIHKVQCPDINNRINKQDTLSDNVQWQKDSLEAAGQKYYGC